GRQPAAGSATGARPHLSLHRPRSVGGAPHLAPDRDPLRRPFGRAGADGTGLRAPAPPIHRGAAVERADPRSAGAASASADRVERRDPQPRRSAPGLPIPVALPARARPVPNRFATARREGGGPPPRRP